MHSMIALQVAFCFLVLFVAGLFVDTFHRLADQPLGYSPERILNLETIARRPQLPAYWDKVAENLRAVPGVEQVALTGWPLLTGEANVSSIAVDGGPPSEVVTETVHVTAGWVGVMNIRFVNGRDFRPSETNPGVAIVNRAFARQHFNGQDPTGKWFEIVDGGNPRVRVQVVGLVPDARTWEMRRPIRPTIFVPFHSADAAHALQPSARGTFVVRTSRGDPLGLAAALRDAVSRENPQFFVENIRTQLELLESQTVRERLLAVLAMFFAAVALLLAGVGLYGVLDYSVLQRRREIGIRIAIGAGAGEIARRVTADVFVMVIAGAVGGLVLGMLSVRYIQTLFYQVRPTDPHALAVPSLVIVGAALLAALPAIIHALRTDLVKALRAE
jgi:predicted permease